MKNIRLYTCATLLATLTFAACEKSSTLPEPTHNPLIGTVWESSRYETPGGEFDYYTERLLFKTETSGEIVSIVSVVYYSGDDYGYTWDTAAAITYRLNTVDNDLYITSDYPGNPGHLKYNAAEETLTVVSNGDVYVRVM